MKTLDLVLAWGVVVLGVIHAAATFTSHPYSLGSVWFFSGGAAIIMGGLLNVIRIRVGGRGFVRGSAILANLLLVAVLIGVTWFARHRLGSSPQVLIVWVLVAGEFVFSLRGGR